MQGLCECQLSSASVPFTGVHRRALEAAGGSTACRAPRAPVKLRVCVISSLSCSPQNAPVPLTCYRLTESDLAPPLSNISSMT